MRWTALVFVMALGLAGCGGSSATTPLGRALVAMRAGDYASFVKARADADAAQHAAWQIGMDKCKVTAADIDAHGEAALLESLDQPAVFKLSEEARFVYAAKYVGRVDAVIKAAYTKPTMQSWYHTDFRDAATQFSPGLPCMTGMIAAGASTPLAEGQPDELERRALLKDWMDDLIKRHGATAFNDSMHDALALLDRNGYSAEWPAHIEFVDDGAPETFGQVQAEIAGAGH
jgi:hypothetical protein